jgi:hypothetical protein
LAIDLGLRYMFFMPKMLANNNVMAGYFCFSWGW